MKTLGEVLKKSIEYLQKKGIQNPRREGEEVLSCSLQMPRIDLYVHFDKPLLEHEIEKVRCYLKRRAEGEPNSYIQGEVEFLDCSLKVNPSVLIPRHETELMVDHIIQRLALDPLEGKELWDMGTGSGCIAIAIKKRYPQLKVVASDLSEKALQLAKENAQKNHVEIEFLLGDKLAPFQDRKTNYLISNPPYVSEAELPTIEKEVLAFEPHMSLVAKNDGLEFYEYFNQMLPKRLLPGGKAWFEFGFTQKEALSQLFSSYSIQFFKDLASWDRFCEILL